MMADRRSQLKSEVRQRIETTALNLFGSGSWRPRWAMLIAILNIGNGSNPTEYGSGSRRPRQKEWGSGSRRPRGRSKQWISSNLTFNCTICIESLKKNDVFHEAINLKPISETDHFSINDEAYTASLDTNKKIPYLVGFYPFRLSH